MRVVVTGGAGFIGSHLARALLDDGHSVVVIDELSTGFREHVPAGADFVEGSIVDGDLMREAVAGAEVVFHLAAARAVGRSVEDPLTTDKVNTQGTLTLLLAAREQGVRRVVMASSSSVYGGAAPLPTPEDAPLVPKSPYAVSKLAGEHYARVFWELYGLETVRLRYFNVFGPAQRPDSPYAAVIPLFAQAILEGRVPEIHGDGLQSRDFTYIDDVVQANRLVMSRPADVVAGKVYNIARNDSTTILDVWQHLQAASGTSIEPNFTDPRPGDIRHSRAQVDAAQAALGFSARTTVAEGLDRYWRWIARDR